MQTKHLLLLGLFGLVLAVVLSAPSIGRIIEVRQFYAELDQIHEIVGTWRAPPPGADPDQWENRWGTLSTAITNVCYSPSSVPPRELQQLTQDLRQKDREPDGGQKMNWLWLRLAEMSSHGKKYISGRQSGWDAMSAILIDR